MAHCDVDHTWSMLSKPMDKCQTNYSDTEDKDAAYVGNTCIEGLGSFLSRSNARDRLEDQNVGEEDNEKVQQDHCKYNHNRIETIKGDVSTG